MENVLDLTGRKYIVTGASSGIGRATCKYLAKLGAAVILVARNEENLKTCLEELEGTGHKYYIFDLSKIEGIEGLVKKIVEENGKLDGLVHSAGVGPTIPLKNTTYEVIQDVMKINFFAFVELLRVFSLKKYNTGSGAVVGVSSITSIMATKGTVAYSASKGAMDSAIRSAVKELSDKNIRVNSVQPAWVKSAIADNYLDEVAGAKEDKITFIEPIEVASVIAFLLSDASSGINGTSIILDGKNK